MLEDIERLAIRIVVPRDGTDRLRHLDGRLVQHSIPFSDSHEGSRHASPDSRDLVENRIPDAFDAGQTELIGHPLVLGLLGEFVEQAPAALSPERILTLDPIGGEIESEGRLRQGGIAGTVDMGEHAGAYFFHLLFGLLSRQLLGIIYQQPDDLRLMLGRLPEFQGESVIPTDLLGELSKLGQPDPATFETTGALSQILPIGDSAFVAIFLQKRHDIGFLHGGILPIRKITGKIETVPSPRRDASLPWGCPC